MLRRWSSCTSQNDLEKILLLRLAEVNLCFRIAGHMCGINEVCVISLYQKMLLCIADIVIRFVVMCVTMCMGPGVVPHCY